MSPERPQPLATEKKGKVANDYLIMETLGKGGYGEVKKVVHKVTGETRAMKIIAKESCDEGYIQSLMNEITILRNLDHPHIIKLFDVYQDSHFIYMVMEHLAGGDVHSMITKRKQVNESVAAKIIKQVLLAVNYFHNKSIVHRDLKPENILLEMEDRYDEVKVIDFGLSRVFQKDKMMCQRLGTPAYVAPEVLNKKYNEKCDVWSIGIILHTLLSGSPPFHGRYDEQIFEQIQLGYITFNGPEWKGISNEAKIFIKKLL